MTMRYKLQIINFFFSDIVFCKETKLRVQSRTHFQEERQSIRVSIKLVHAMHAPVPTLFITTPVSTLEKVPLLGGVSVLESSIIRNTP